MNDIRPEYPGSDSGDHTWHDAYARRTPAPAPQYDTRTSEQHIADLEQRIKHLEGVVHRYINRTEGTL